MHPLRFNAYLVLIHALLYCHPDKHLEVLRVNSGLINPFLVHLMKQVAAILAAKGDKRAAESLQIRAAQIALELSWDSGQGE